MAWSSNSPVCGRFSLLGDITLSGGILPIKLINTLLVLAPEILIMATADLPLAVAGAKIVSFERPEKIKLFDPLHEVERISSFP